MIRKCKYCGKKFDTADGRRTYCSEECQRAAKKEYLKQYRKLTASKAPKPKYIKICAVCGAEFSTERSTQVYCSKQCAKKYQKHCVREYNKRLRRNRKSTAISVMVEPQPEFEKKGIEYQFLTPDQKIFYGETQSKAYADSFKVVIPKGLMKAKDRQNETSTMSTKLS